MIPFFPFNKEAYKKRLNLAKKLEAPSNIRTVRLDVGERRFRQLLRNPVELGDRIVELRREMLAAGYKKVGSGSQRICFKSSDDPSVVYKIPNPNQTWMKPLASKSGEDLEEILQAAHDEFGFIVNSLSNVIEVRIYELGAYGPVVPCRLVYSEHGIPIVVMEKVVINKNAVYRKLKTFPESIKIHEAVPKIPDCSNHEEFGCRYCEHKRKHDYWTVEILEDNCDNLDGTQYGWSELLNSVAVYDAGFNDYWEMDRVKCYQQIHKKHLHYQTEINPNKKHSNENLLMIAKCT